MFPASTQEAYLLRVGALLLSEGTGRPYLFDECGIEVRVNSLRDIGAISFRRIFHLYLLGHLLVVDRFVALCRLLINMM